MAEQLRVQTSGRRDQLAGALQREMQMDARDAQEIASFVLGAFEDEEELDDREIDSDLRSVFYELEEHKLLAFRRETYRNEDGHKRRAFYWTIRWSEVQPAHADETDGGEGQDTVYDDLPQNAWARGSGA